MTDIAINPLRYKSRVPRSSRVTQRYVPRSDVTVEAPEAPYEAQDSGAIRGFIIDQRRSRDGRDVPWRLPPSDLLRIWTLTKRCAPTTRSRRASRRLRFSLTSTHGWFR